MFYQIIFSFLCMGALVPGRIADAQNLAWNNAGLGLDFNPWALGGLPQFSAGPWLGGGLLNSAFATPQNSWALGGAPIGPDGRVVDTPEVALAKAQHLSTAGRGLSSWALGGTSVGLDGRVIDTPEVAAAKSQHYAAKANANSAHKV